MKTGEAVLTDVGMLNEFISYEELKEIKELEKEEIYALTLVKEEKGIKTYIYKFIKRLLDIIAGIVGFVILLPITAVVYIANKINKEEGPLFFIQERIGKKGKIFRMVKYRSMVVDAEEKLHKYLNENNNAKLEYKTYKKIKDDPRVTKVGKFLRKTSLDEMPQLLHLLTGKMTLVGPRPYLPSEKEDMGEYYGIITKYKPGITGLWQVTVRSNVTFEDRLDIDTTYHKIHSLKCDFKILYKTFMHVIKKEGAM